MISVNEPVINKPLNLSLAVLEVFPYTYWVFKNMGVTASMSISLIRDKIYMGINVIIIHLSMWAMKCVLLASFLGKSCL